MSASRPDRQMIALGIRQPWAELILRGVKTIEVRSQNTNKRGRIYVYASKLVSDHAAAATAINEHGLQVDSLPKGVLVGTVELFDSTPCTAKDSRAACLPRRELKGRFAWRLRDPQRLEKPLPIRFMPYGIWFYPFKRRSGAG